MLAAILSIIDAIGSEVVTVLAVWLGWRLGASTQRTQRRLDALDRRFEALSEIMAVADNVPSHLSYDELVTQLETDDKFWGSMSSRLVRLSGIRRERVGWLDPAIVDFIDDRLRPLYRSGVGQFDLPRDRAREFATLALELPELVARTERKLLRERQLLEEGRTRFWPWIASLRHLAKRLPGASRWISGRR